MCFASRTPGLCSASLFSSLPLFAHVCLFAGVLRFANHDVAQCCPSFAPLRFCSLIRSLFFMVIFCFAYFALQASGLRGAFKLRVCVVLLYSVLFRFATFYLLCDCASSRKPSNSVLCSASFFSSFPFLHTFACLPVCFTSQTMMLRSAVLPSPL